MLVESYLERSLRRQRPPAILEKETTLTTHADEKDVFVAYNGKIAVAGYNVGHHETAKQMQLYYPEESSATLVVDDGGHMYDDGEKIIITPYFTGGTQPRELREAIRNSESEEYYRQVEKHIRKKTGQLVANITGRNVETLHGDGTIDVFSPKKGFEGER